MEELLDYPNNNFYDFYDFDTVEITSDCKQIKLKCLLKFTAWSEIRFNFIEYTFKLHNINAILIGYDELEFNFSCKVVPCRIVLSEKNIYLRTYDRKVKNQNF